MRFLSVAERELRAASRRVGMYRVRWITAVAFFVLLLWMAWAYDLFQNRNAGPDVFLSFSVVTFFYCLLVGAAGTADGISREKREGTLGLLFLTNLNSAEIVVGKLCSNGLMLVYSLLAIFPVLALPVLIGGISLGQLGRTILALANALFFGMASGFVASSLCVRQFPAVALATGLALTFALGPLGASEVLPKMSYPKIIAEAFAAFCPLNTLLAADETRAPFNSLRYWRSLAGGAAMSFMWLALVTWAMSKAWRDRPKNIRAWNRFGFGASFRQRADASRRALRRRLLEINPIFWLAGRQRISAPIFMLISVVLVLITVTASVPFFTTLVGTGGTDSLVGHLIAWVWTALAIHALVLYYGATIASQRLAEDKQIGALELILSTPTSEQSIGRGLWLAYGRKMLFPGLVAVLIQLFFFWQCVAAFQAESSEHIPRNVTTWRFVTSALFNQPINGFLPEWHMGFILRILLLLLVVLIANWLMLGWLGRWLGLRMKHPAFAPMVAVTLAVAPPIGIFSFVLYLGVTQWNLHRMPEHIFLPMMMWIGFGIGIGNCVILSAWAAGKLRREFRTTVTSRFEPPAVRRWWRPSRRGLRRFATWIAAWALIFVAMGLFFYAFQTWKSQRRWTAFEKELKQRGESLDLFTVIPGPVPDQKNFARTQIFQKLSRSGSPDKMGASLLGRSAPVAQLGNSPLRPNSPDPAWPKQAFLDFDEQLEWIVPNFSRGSIKERNIAAAAVWEGLKPLDQDLAAVAQAAHLPGFQLRTNRNPEMVYQSNPKEVAVMLQLHFLFQLRACCALLALNRSQEAGEDVMTSLRLAQLARQSPDVKSSTRVQMMVVRSLQPIWEGLVEHRWSEPQLAAFQKELGEFNLLSDHTNAIRRATLAYMETWRSRAEGKSASAGSPRGGDGYEREWQPRAWWLDNSIELYRAAQKAIARVDVASGKVDGGFEWIDLDGLPLDGDTAQLFQLSSWNVGPTFVSYAQTAVNQAILACALDRYRLAHGAYPETLEPLQPDYLSKIPNDILRGIPMFYRLNDKNSYALRGVGPNGVIDQGKMPPDDWVWAFSAQTNLPPAKVIKKK